MQQNNKKSKNYLKDFFPTGFTGFSTGGERYVSSFARKKKNIIIEEKKAIQDLQALFKRYISAIQELFTSNSRTLQDRRFQICINWI